MEACDDEDDEREIDADVESDGMTEGVSTDELLIGAFMDYHAIAWNGARRSYQHARTVGEYIEHLRGIAEDQALNWRLGEVLATDAQLTDAARDAFERWQDLRRRYKARALQTES